MAVKIQDNGVGISDDKLRNLFERLAKVQQQQKNCSGVPESGCRCARNLLNYMAVASMWIVMRIRGLCLLSGFRLVKSILILRKWILKPNRKVFAIIYHTISLLRLKRLQRLRFWPN